MKWTLGSSDRKGNHHIENLLCLLPFSRQLHFIDEEIEAQEVQITQEPVQLTLEHHYDGTHSHELLASFPGILQFLFFFLKKF